MSGTVYTTIKQTSEFELVEKKSRFIARVVHAETEADAIAEINSVRAAHSDARHVCYAYKVSDNGTLYSRYSDDGEPQGTAGMPMLDVIEKQGLCNVVLTVTRYFGGVLLGAAGLVRAYSGASSECLNNAGRLSYHKGRTVTFCVAYQDSGALENVIQSKLIPNYKVILISKEYLDSVTMKCFIASGDIDSAQDTVTQATSGRVQISVSDTDEFRAV